MRSQVSIENTQLKIEDQRGIEEAKYVLEEDDDIIIKCGLDEMVKLFFKDYIIVWHDPNVKSEENNRYISQLERFCKVETFTEWKETSRFVQNTKVMCRVITSGTNGEFLVKEICSNQSVLEIYIFCESKDYHSIWAQNYQKVSCVEIKIENILDRIQQNLLKWYQDISSFKTTLPAFAPIFNDWDKSGMNNLHRYLKILPNFKNRAYAKNDILALSRVIYSDKANMEKFEKTYNQFNKKEILKWYTEDSFVYRVTNNCLRIATSDSIQYCRLFLRDLEQAIKEQYQEKSKNFAGLLYRGAFLSDREWLNLKANLGRKIEMHGFLSTSKDKKSASNFTKSDPTKKVFITIIVPKGPNEAEQGFAEVEEFSAFPGEKEILFNVRSRFTVLEADDRYSPSLPCRHLVLLYGAQGLRKYIAEKNPLQEVLIPDANKVSCFFCDVSMSETSEKFFFKPMSDLEMKNLLFCRACVPAFLEDNNTPLLCIPVLRNPGPDQPIQQIKVQGVLTTYPVEMDLPMYGYKCYECQKKKKRLYLKCTGCSEGRVWCEDCIKNERGCREVGHALILERRPFSFWCGKMPQKELDHLKFQNGMLKRHIILQQGAMFFQNEEYEKAIKFYNIYIEQNKENRKDIGLFLAYNHLTFVYNNQAEHIKAIQYNSKAMELSKSFSDECIPDTVNLFRKMDMVIYSQAGGESTIEDVIEDFSKAMETCKSFDDDQHSDEAFSEDNLVKVNKGKGNFENLMVAICCSNRGIVHQSQGDYKSALEDFSKALDLFRPLYGENHEKIAWCYNNIAMVYQKQAECRKALEHFSKALKIYKTFYGDHHPDIALCYNNMAVVHRDQAEYKTAFEYFSKALEIFKLFHGENHTMVASSSTNIGDLYSCQGEWQKSFESHFKALEIYKSLHGDHNFDIAKCYNNLAVVYQKQAEYRKSLKYYSKALESYKAFYGDHHPDIATCYNNIGTVFLNQSKYESALQYFSKALEIYKASHDDHHSDIAKCYNNLAFVFQNQAEYDKALQYFSKALEISKAFYGDHHPDIATCYNNIGTVFLNQSKYESALQYFSKALEIYKASHDGHHSDIARCYNNLAAVYQKQAEYRNALKYYSKALESYKAFHGGHHPDVARCYNNIGMVFLNQSKYESALQDFSKALEIYKAFYGDHHPDIATCYNNIGMIFHSQAKYESALQDFSKALKILKSFHGNHHPDVAMCYNNIGLVFYSLAKYESSLQHFSKALKIFKSFHDDNHPDVGLCYQNLGCVYASQTEYMLALDSFSNALKIVKLFYDDNHSSVEMCSKMIANLCHRQAEKFQNEKRDNDALEYYTKALKNYRLLPDDNDSPTKICYQEIAAIYQKKAVIYQTQKGYLNACEHYFEAERIMKMLYGTKHSKTIAVRNRMIVAWETFLENNNELRERLICLNILYLILSPFIRNW